MIYLIKCQKYLIHIVEIKFIYAMNAIKLSYYMYTSISII